MPVLSVRNFSVSFTQYYHGFRQSQYTAIHDLSLLIQRGEIVAVVGSSGSGKSLLAHGILGILPYNAEMTGEIEFLGEPLTSTRLRDARGRTLALIPQGVTWLDPLMQIGAQLRQGRRGAAARQKARAVLARYGLAEATDLLYPFELSGGMARRVLIAAAVQSQPGLIVADEPTPGLDAPAAHRILGHFRELADLGAGVLFITHDLELAIAVADRIVVFYGGMTVEEMAVSDFSNQDTLRHPYTRALWAALPQNGFSPPPVVSPRPVPPIGACPYAAQCPLYTGGCDRPIALRPLRGGQVRCIHAV